MQTDQNAFILLLFKLFVTLLLLVLISGCATLPPNTNSEKTYALTDTADTEFGKAHRSFKNKHPNDSGFFLLANGLDAFAARLILAKMAESSIDAQYYMIHADLTGALFADQLIKAADRGVRVRLLIDDMDLENRDEGLNSLASHPNIMLRIFNPFSRNTLRLPQYISRLGSVTRRMHNKSFTVDNQITVVGGRNIGNEYFEADPDLSFGDLDLLAIGPVVQQVSKSFDEYWNNHRAYPVNVLRPDLAEQQFFATGRKQLAEYLATDRAKDYLNVLETSGLISKIGSEKNNFDWGEAEVLSDHPNKLDSYETTHQYSLATQISPFFSSLQSELLIFSPYFVPGKIGTKHLNNLSREGVRVRIITNSLASTDVGLVHAGYAKYRKSLLKAGVELFEVNKKWKRTEPIESKGGNYGSSKASLHAKSFVLDRDQVFIGSLNLDPRSVKENTEIGIMLSSDKVAEKLANLFDKIVAEATFRLELKVDDDGFESIVWHGLESGEKRTWNFDPHTSFWHRLGIGLMGFLPIESQL